MLALGQLRYDHFADLVPRARATAAAHQIVQLLLEPAAPAVPAAPAPAAGLAWLTTLTAVTPKCTSPLILVPFLLGRAALPGQTLFSLLLRSLLRSLSLFRCIRPTFRLGRAGLSTVCDQCSGDRMLVAAV